MAFLRDGRRGFLKAFLGTLLVLAALEQLRFRLLKRKEKSNGTLSGPKFSPPFIGDIVSIISNPHKFWEDQRDYGSMSWNTFFGKFMVFTTDIPTIRRAFLTNSPDSLLVTLHPSASLILGEDNIAFQHGPSHKALRASFLNLFTKKALSTYFEVQCDMIKEHLAQWKRDCANGEFIEMWTRVRDLNSLTSQRVFLGDYIDDSKRFNELYMNVTRGFLCVPIYFPGTTLWNAVRSSEKVKELLAIAVGRSKKRMSIHGAEPNCLLDYWTQHMLKAIQTNAESGLPPPQHSSDVEMGNVMLDFLFAAQDASTASLDWVLAFMCDYPDMMARVKEEQASIRPNGEALDFDMLTKMDYTRAVVMETLRIRAPAPMVPMTAQKDTRISEDYVVPKDSLFVVDLWRPSRDGFPNGDVFDPDRMMPHRREDKKYKEAFLTFGFGPHVCVGQNYAINHLTAFLAEIALNVDMERKITEKSHTFELLPAVCPGDCLIRFT